jgi:site-specific recombinase XerD
MLPAAAVAALRHHRGRQAVEAMSSQRRNQGLVFTHLYGGPLETSTVWKRLEATLTSAGISEQRAHDLRHHGATYIVANGVHVCVVTDVLGHAERATTTDV